jgi:hypothetical protein
MHCKLAVIVLVLAGLLPLVARGEATNQEPATLRLQVSCRSGAVVTLDKARLVEKGVRKEGSNPQSTDPKAAATVRLNMPDAGTVAIPWDKIEKIAVGGQSRSEDTYTIEVTLKDVQQTKVGTTYGYDNTIIGQSDVGEFSISLKDVKEIVTLPPAEEK